MAPRWPSSTPLQIYSNAYIAASLETYRDWQSITSPLMSILHPKYSNAPTVPTRPLGQGERIHRQRLQSRKTRKLVENFSSFQTSQKFSLLCRCVRMHLNKQHGLTEIPPEIWESAHPLLSETTKLLNETKTFVSLQSTQRDSMGAEGNGVVRPTLANQLRLLAVPTRSQSSKSKGGSNNPSAATGVVVKKR